MINFKSIPFLKIIFPFIVGIVFSLQFGVFKTSHFFLLLSFLVLIAAFLFQKFYKPFFYFKKAIYIFFVNVFLFLLAQEALYVYQDKNNANHYSHYVSAHTQGFMGVIDDIPVVTEKFIKLSLQINTIQQNGTWHYAFGKTLVYLSKDSAQLLKTGNSVYIQSKFSKINEPNNPNEFNYKSFLESKNIFNVVYAKAPQLTVYKNTNPGFSIAQLGTRIKAKVISVLRKSNLSQQAFSICSALLVGYDDEIEGDILQSFSHSGTLHILSVSGLHTGVLYGILMLVFSFFDKHDQHKTLKCLAVILSLLCFVCITGFSPSVLRASLMLSLVIIGKTFYKQGNSYNTLLLSAFILLLVNPFLIIDVGFLLSYFAVFGIMYFYPILDKLHRFNHKIVQWLWSSVLISVSATLFTLPISLYFFHQFPIWFAIANLIIIPVSMVLMIGAIVFVVLYKITIINHLLVWLLNSTTALMLWLAQLTNNPHYGYIDYIAFDKADVIGSTLIITVFLLLIQTKQYKFAVLAGVLVSLWVSDSIYKNYQILNQKEIVVFHVKHKSAIAIRLGKTIYLKKDSTISEKEIQRFVKPYLLTFSSPKIITTSANSINYTNGSIAIVDKNQPKINVLLSNYIIISHNNPVELTYPKKTPPLIIADCTNSYKFIKELQKKCSTFGIPFYSVKENGALQILL